MSAADELQIRNLIAQMAQVADECQDLAEYGALFCEDAHWEIKGQSAFRGREQIIAGAAQRRSEGLVGPGSHTRHVITTLQVQVEGEHASATCTCLFYTDTATQPTVRALTKYSDEFVRTPEGWRMSRRLIELC